MDSVRRKPQALSVHRAFVVEVAAGSNVRSGRIAGRVEHVVTGRSAEFSAADELLDFVTKVLESGTEPGRPSDERRNL